MSDYQPAEIESKWQALWEESEAFKCSEESSKPKKYILDMFPYPSGAGLHVGHIMNYTATDIISRYWRARGYEVLHPMGWDSFGLPAEQYALRTGTHPAKTTEKNINKYRAQLKRMGLSYDWSREFATSDPKYFKWTQWIFTKLYEKGLAYEAEMMVNYCPKLGTVLANEEVESGRSVEGGYEVVRRPLKQWILKITAYADRLIDDLNTLDWPEHLKNQQRHWIGRSEGANVTFALEKALETHSKGFGQTNRAVSDSPSIDTHQSQSSAQVTAQVNRQSNAQTSSLKVFTTQPQTLLGVSFLAIAPEHPLVDELTTEEHQLKVREYCERAAHRSDLERSELSKEKRGCFTGSYAIHPITQRLVPIWVADYVLMGYASGCVMGVPAHDSRDWEFAKRYDLPILPVQESASGEKHDYTQGALTELGNMLNLPEGSDLMGYRGCSASEAKKKTIEWLEAKGHGSRGVSYKLRDWLFSRQRYWGEPIPIIHLKDGTQRALGVDELPLLPPQVSDYRPAGDGRSPLAKVTSWVELPDGSLRETNTMPQWAGSCWYYLRFCDPHNDGEAWSLKRESYWMPVDIYVGGIEHAVLHLLYARFWHKVLYDLGLVSTTEPFQLLKNQGMVVAHSFRAKSGQYHTEEEVDFDGKRALLKETGEELTVALEKMSKSKLNGVSPDEITHKYGADALRLYEMFMGPFDKEKVWTSEAVAGCYRFLKRVWALAHTHIDCKDSASERGLAEANALAVQTGKEDVSLALTHRLIRDVEEDLQKWYFNTAIAKMMEWINVVARLPSVSRETLELFVRLLYPFAPHISQELWQRLGHQGLLHDAGFPSYNSELVESLKSDKVTIVGQVNGKVRCSIEVACDVEREAAIEQMRCEPRLAKYLEGVEIVREIWVRGKLVNFVTR